MKRGSAGAQQSEHRSKFRLQKSMSTGGSGKMMSQDDVDKVEELLQDEDEQTKRLVRAGLQAKRTIRKDDLQAYLKEQMAATRNCLMFPVTFLFFISYAVCVLGHENFADSHMVQRQIRGMLEGSSFEGVHVSGHKFLSDIAGKEDVYRYLKEVVAPLFITADPQGNDPFRVLRYNQIIGGVQLTQLRRKKVSCTGEYPSLGPFIRDGKTNPILAGFGCFPWYTESEECMKNAEEAWEILVEGWCPDKKTEREGLTRRLQDQSHNETSVDVSRTLMQGLGGDGTDHPGARSGADTGEGTTFSAYLYEHEGLDRALEKIGLLETNGWIDLNTAWVGIRILILNPDLAVFVHSTVHVYFPPSGEVKADISAQSFIPEPYQDKMAIGLDAFFLAFLALLFFKVFYGIYKSIVSGKAKAWFKDGWNWVDLLTTLGGITCIIMWLVLLDKLEDAKRVTLEVRQNTPELGNLEDGPYKESVQIMHNNMAALSAYLSAYRLVIGWYAVLCVGKFFEAFHSQPRLAIVTKTLSGAFVDLLHFLVVFIMIFFGYAVAGMFIFGTRVWNFSSFALSINECFMIIMGDFDWGMLGSQHFVTAALWFWTFTLIIVFVMLNMVMAVIMDCYSEVSGDAADTEPIWTQGGRVIEEVLGDFAHNRASNSDILEALGKLPETVEEIDEELLIKTAGERMSLDQCMDIFIGVKNREEKALSKGMALSDAMRAIGWIRIAVQKIGIKVESIIKEEQEELDMLEQMQRAGESPAKQNGMTENGDGAHEQDDGGGLRSIMDSDQNHSSVSIDNYDPFKVTGNLSSKFAHGGSPFANHPVDSRLHRVVWRLSKVEEFLNEAMQYTVYRGKDLRNRLAVIEDLLRSQRDSVMMSVEKKVWDKAPPTLGARSGVGGAPISSSMTSMM